MNAYIQKLPTICLLIACMIFLPIARADDDSPNIDVNYGLDWTSFEVSGTWTESSWHINKAIFIDRENNGTLDGLRYQDIYVSVIDRDIPKEAWDEWVERYRLVRTVTKHENTSSNEQHIAGRYLEIENKWGKDSIVFYDYGYDGVLDMVTYQNPMVTLDLEHMSPEDRSMREDRFKETLRYASE